MTSDALTTRLRALIQEEMPLPGSGRTPERHHLLSEIAREDVSLSKLAEAHWDAVAILAEAGRIAQPGLLYAVWASEIPDKSIRLVKTPNGFRISGSKPFCSGLGLVDRALLTVGLPEPHLVELDLERNAQSISVDLSSWKVDAFRETHTGGITFSNAELSTDALVGSSGWYLTRPGFWHGACGPASCWVGGLAGLLDYALESKRDDPHTLAHLGAIQAGVWGMYALLDQAGREIDSDPLNITAAQIRALQLRHLIEHSGSEILHAFARAYGPYPLTMNDKISRRHQEVSLYMRQSHGERDLEALARMIAHPLKTNQSIEKSLSKL